MVEIDESQCMIGQYLYLFCKKFFGTKGPDTALSALGQTHKHYRRTASASHDPHKKIKASFSSCLSIIIMPDHTITQQKHDDEIIRQARYTRSTDRPPMKPSHHQRLNGLMTQTTLGTQIQTQPPLRSPTVRHLIQSEEGEGN